MRNRNHAAPSGFTIIELLTVIAVIILIISMIVPGISYAKKIAKDVRVRNQIKSLGEGVEAFYGQYEFYPPSERSGAGAGLYTCGSEKFTEALVGLDLHGYDPVSNFDVVTSLASTRAYVGSASIARRKEMYITPIMEMLAVDVNNAPTALYANWGNLYASPASGVKVGRLLCDAMKAKEIPGDGGKMLNPGTPFLYFKANTDSKIFDNTKATGNIYNYQDNRDLLELMPLPGETDKNGNLVKHAWSPAVGGGMKAFYDAITNPAITTQARPFNMNTYLIISAGADGVFGTSDDISNFRR
jgi:type II secretory pathway pseudopilin PulG